MKRQILLITSIYPPQSGGPAVFTSRFYQWLEERNYGVKVITYCLQIEPRTRNIIKIRVRPFRILSFVKFTLEIVKNSNKNTLILANGGFLEMFLASFLCRRKYVAKIPGDLIWEFSKNKGWTTSPVLEFQREKMNLFQKFFRKIWNLGLRRAKFVITPSHQLENIARTWGLERNKLKLIYNCVDSQKFISFGNNRKEYDLITVCRLVPGKGLEELIQVSIKLGFSLAIVGEGPLLEKLMLLAGRNPNVHFIGNLKNESLPEILNLSKIFVLNSDSEATSYAIIEAKMCGLPVIARINDGTITLVNHNEDGLVFSGIGSNNLENSISTLISNDDLIKEFSQKTRQDAILRFDQNANFNKILGLIDN